ncbi:hypothetical protein Tco_0558772 [Tanacetum coccineum]
MQVPTRSSAPAVSAPPVAGLSPLPTDRLPPHKRVASSEKEITSLRVRVKVVELSDESSRVSLDIAGTGLAELRHQLRDTKEQLQLCQISQISYKERIERLEAYLHI